MGFQNNIKSTQDEMMNLVVLSTDAKPRLKWTPDLHQRFIDAVNQLGGGHKATPKGLMRVMGIPGLTLYHLKSHLQKYRLGKNHHQEVDESCDDSSKQEDDKDSPVGVAELINEKQVDSVRKPTSDGNLQITKALELQMEVQRRLHEQIEVQRHLQLRIEAQGKYLQKVLKKAQETLSGYASSRVGVEDARAELTHLVSMVSTECGSSSLSELTSSRALSLQELDRYVVVKGRSSMESSLTSSDTAREEDKVMKIGEEDEDVDQLQVCDYNNRPSPYVLPLLEQSWNNDGQLIAGEKPYKRKGGGSSAFYEVDRSSRTRLAAAAAATTTCMEELEECGLGKKLKLFGTLDLNSQFQSPGLGQTQIDLNSKETEQLDGEYLAL